MATRSFSRFFRNSSDEGTSPWCMVATSWSNSLE